MNGFCEGVWPVRSRGPAGSMGVALPPANPLHLSSHLVSPTPPSVFPPFKTLARAPLTWSPLPRIRTLTTLGRLSGLKNVSARGEGRGSPRRGRGGRTPGNWFQPAAVSLPGASVNLASAFPLASLLLGASGLSRFYRYAGSLTTRCCEPVELWTVFEDTVPIGRAQVQPAPPPQPPRPPVRRAVTASAPHPQVVQFRIVAQARLPGSRPAPLTENFRPQQPLCVRRVVASPSASVRAAAPTPARGTGLSWAWGSACGSGRGPRM